MVDSTVPLGAGLSSSAAIECATAVGLADLVGLDLTHPGVREHLAEELARLRGLGIGYLKLDFLYGGAIPGRRHDDVSEVEAYRRGLALVRDAVGPDVYLLGCGAPILPSVGLVDAMRVSPDTFHEGGEDGSSGLRGLMPLTARSAMLVAHSCMEAGQWQAERKRRQGGAARGGWRGGASPSRHATGLTSG